MVRDGFMSKMVLGAWTVWAGGNTRRDTRDEKNPINMGLRLGACVSRSSDSKETNMSGAEGACGFLEGERLRSIIQNLLCYECYITFIKLDLKLCIYVCL